MEETKVNQPMSNEPVGFPGATQMQPQGSKKNWKWLLLLILFLIVTIIWPIFFSVISSMKLIQKDWEEVVEIEGLMQIISDPTTIMNQREAAAYVELTRKFGNEAQRMTEAASATKSEKMSAFKALEDMAKAGYKIEISKDEKRVPIDVDYTQIMDDKIPDPSQK